MLDNYEVLIVGGGPAGLAAAEVAARQGVRTLVLERQNEIGYPVHTSGGSWVQDMKALNIPDHLYHPVKKIYFVSPRREVLFSYQNAVTCVLDVRGVYQHFAGRAIAAGATVRVRHTVDQVLQEGNRIVGVTVKNHVNERSTVHAPLTIDASGFSRHIGVRANLGGSFRRYGFGAEYDLYAPHYPQDEVFLIVGSAFAPQGYAWAFPRGNGRVRLGVGVIHPDNDEDARIYLDRIMYDIPQLAERFKDASPVEYHTGLFPSERFVERFSANGLLLAGDAGAHGSTLVGEGIRFAIYSGQMAGEVAAEAIKTNNISATFLSRFDKRWHSRFGRDMEISYLINRHISTYTDQAWDDALDIIKRFTPNQMAQAMHCDFTPGLIMGMLARNPSLVATGGKRLLQRMLEQVHKPVATATN